MKEKKWRNKIMSISNKDKAKIGGMFLNDQDGEDTSLDQRISSGKVLHLSQGEKVVLRNEDNTEISNISLGMGWAPSSYGDSMDLDASVVVYSNKINTDLIYFGKLMNYNKSIFHHGDNLVGSHGKTADQNDEDIDVNLGRLDESIDELFFIVNIYQANLKGQSFGQVKDLYIRVYSVNNNQKTLKLDFKIDQGQNNSSGVVIAKMRKSPRGWTFQAVGKYANASKPDAMIQYCR
jgi:stress response protein SCP2